MIRASPGGHASATCFCCSLKSFRKLLATNPWTSGSRRGWWGGVDNDKGAVEGILSSRRQGRAVPCVALTRQCDACDGLDNSPAPSSFCFRSWCRGAESLLLGAPSAIFSLLIISLCRLVGASPTILLPWKSLFFSPPFSPV